MSTPLVSDEELWKRSLDGDERAFTGIFDRHRDRVFRHALARTDVRADADDVTAIAFLELWRRRLSVRLVDGSILPWLLVTTTYTARNSTRSRRRYAAALARLPHGDSAPAAEDEVMRRLPVEETSAELAKAMSGLSTIDEQLLMLTAVEGLSAADAATVVGIRPDAARARISRARRRLAKSLDHPSLSDLSEATLS